MLRSHHTLPLPRQELLRRCWQSIKAAGFKVSRAGWSAATGLTAVPTNPLLHKLAKSMETQKFFCKNGDRGKTASDVGEYSNENGIGRGYE